MNQRIAIRRAFSPSLEVLATSVAAAIAVGLTGCVSGPAAPPAGGPAAIDWGKVPTTKAKKGPSLSKIAAKYRENKLDEKEALKHMTSGKKVKLDDGKEEDHKVIDTKDVAVQTNVAKWMLTH